MKAIIFNDTQNFNGSLNFLNERYRKRDKRFWDYKKYIPFIVKKVKSAGDLTGQNVELVKTYFYEGKYSSNLISSFKWSLNSRVAYLNNIISKEKALLDTISKYSTSSRELRKKVSKHVEEVKKTFENEKEKCIIYRDKQERNFEGQKALFEELKNNPLVELKLTPLKQSNGKIYQKGVDVLLATDLVHLAHINAYDIAIILSGDTDLVEAVKLIKSLGKIPIIVSYYDRSNPMNSNISDLMDYGKFINLADLTHQEVEEMSDLRENIGR